MRAPGWMITRLPISALAMLAPAAIEQSRPMRTCGPMAAPAPTTVPAPISAPGPITAPGSTTTPCSSRAVGWTKDPGETPLAPKDEPGRAAAG